MDFFSDPVIIIVMSYLIAKKKLYSEETVGCDIFQRELINLLSCHFNYKFSIDVPTNFIQHIHKPGKLIHNNKDKIYLNNKLTIVYYVL